MPREKEAYRDNLERIIAAYPGKEMLTVTDVLKFTGISRQTAKKMFPFNQYGYISVATLARSMS